MAPFEFHGEVVFITGASQGIGRAIAIAFAKCGAIPIINYRSNDTGALETLEEIKTAGGKGVIKKFDVNNFNAVQKTVNEIENEIGPIEVLVNNAAAFNRSHFLEVPMDELERVLNTNFRSVFYLSQLVAKSMAKRKRGCIIHISSILAQQAVPNRTAYCASKGALESLTRAMALDLASFNIRVNAVSPGLIQTEAMMAGFSNPAVLAEVERYIPGGRFGRPEEIANVVLFLASEMASYITGEIIPVNYGLGAREAGPALNQ